MPDPFLPPGLAALADPPPPAVKPLSVRVDLTTLARIEAMRDRLNRPSRGALLRFLLGEGLRHAEAQLQQAAADTPAAVCGWRLICPAGPWPRWPPSPPPRGPAPMWP